jgi:hypothetical protein
MECITDSEELGIVHSLTAVVPFFPLHKCLLYSTAKGKMAIVRQLKPALHLDFDDDFCKNIKPHVKHVTFVKHIPLPEVSMERVNENGKSGGTDVVTLKHPSGVLQICKLDEILQVSLSS